VVHVRGYTLLYTYIIGNEENIFNTNVCLLLFDYILWEKLNPTNSLHPSNNWIARVAFITIRLFTLKLFQLTILFFCTQWYELV